VEPRLGSSQHFDGKERIGNPSELILVQGARGWSPPEGLGGSGLVEGTSRYVGEVLHEALDPEGTGGSQPLDLDRHASERHGAGLDDHLKCNDLVTKRGEPDRLSRPPDGVIYAPREWGVHLKFSETLAIIDHKDAALARPSGERIEQRG
jgi:hypothetical protein